MRGSDAGITPARTPQGPRAAAEHTGARMKATATARAASQRRPGGACGRRV